MRVSRIDAASKIPDAHTCFNDELGDILLAFEPLHAAKLASALLGVPLPARLNAADARFIDHLVGAALRDVLQEVSLALGETTRATTTTQRSVEHCFRFNVSTGGGIAFDVYIDQSRMTSARRVAASSKRAPRALGSRNDALSRQPIRIGARLGSSKVALTDLYSLAAGDVLVLETAIDDSLPATIGGAAKSGLAFKLQRAATSFELSVAHIEGGKS